jgi:putative ATPase
MPEARIILSQCATFLASSPKSNASYKAISKALEAAKESHIQIPLHIRNAPTEMMSSMGYSQGYRYPHDFEGHFVKEHYLPDEIAGTVFYAPSDQGSETQIRQRLSKLWPERYGDKTEATDEQGGKK